MLFWGLISQSPAQISAGGQPYSFSNPVAETPARIKIPTLDIQQIASLESGDGKDEPFQFGYPFEVSYDLHNSGIWSALPDGGRLWRLRIYADGAYSLNLIYDDFHLAEGARFFIYSADKKMLLGAFTAVNNKSNGAFATAPVKGGDCFLELYEPPEQRGRSRLTITRIVYGYKNVFFNEVESFGASGSCNIDINSEAGAGWQTEKRAVAMILTGGGARICSGALVNNVEQDLKQYLLTANHCLGNEEYWIVMFNYESPAGTNEDGPTNYTVQGTTLLAKGTASDFALLEITEPIPPDYNVHFAGWSAESTPATQTVCIHHPSGDVKKISFDDDPPTNDFWSDPLTPPNTHWAVVWDAGTTESGSSGSPLFDQNHRIVGQLHGGLASCSNPYGEDDFGKFSFSWNYYPGETAQLKHWLDPQNTGALTLDGRDYYSIIYTHTELPASENAAGPYLVAATVTSRKPPLGTVWLHYGWNGVFSDSVAMQLTGEADRYWAEIPGGRAEVGVNYYFSATDAGGEIVYSPSAAPVEFYSFYVGGDTTAPQINHASIVDQPLEKWPVAVRAEVTDDLGVNTVFCEYYINDPANAGIFNLHLLSANEYVAAFPDSSGALQVGDIIYYRIGAQDSAKTQNIRYFPESGFLDFKIIAVKGLILIVDDDSESASKNTVKTIDRRPKASYGATARRIRTWLTEENYFAESVSVAAADTLDFQSYDLVISSSGACPYPLADETYRAKLQDWVTNPSHKLLIEGGEIGYAVRETNFTEVVLHSEWRSDPSDSDTLSDDLWLHPERSYHPVARTPDSLPEILKISDDRDVYDQDFQKPGDSTDLLYYVAYHLSNGGVIIYDDNDHPQSAQVIYYAFYLAILADSLVARQLLMNSVHFLLAEEKAAIGAISGRVDLTDTENDSGAAIYLSGTLQDTVITDSTGFFRFENLYDGFYELKAVVPGYVCADSVLSAIQIGQNDIADLNFRFDRTILRGRITAEGIDDYSAAVIWIPERNVMEAPENDGSFYLGNIQPGKISVFFYFPGYVTLRIDTTLYDNADIVLSVTMSRDLPSPRNFSADANDGVVTLFWQNPVIFPESFEAGLPADWTIGNYGSDAAGTTWNVSGTYSHDGEWSARCGFGGADEISDEWLLTNQVEITPIARVLKFWHMASFPEDDNLPNHIRISNGKADTADFTVVYTFPGEALSLPGEWTQVAIDLSAYLAQSVYIAFQYRSQAGENWYLDQVTLAADTILAKADLSNSAKGNLTKFTIPAEEKTLPRSPFRSTFGNSQANLVQYRIYRAQSAGVTIGDENLLALVSAAQVSYLDTNVVSGQTYYYVIVADYGADGISASSAEVSASLSGVGALNPTAALPDRFALAQNFPNPFNPLTTISYQTPQSATVSLAIYNLFGQKVRTLVSTQQPANYYSVIWNGTNDAGQSVASGIYFYRLEAGDFQAVRKMVFLK